MSIDYEHARTVHAMEQAGIVIGDRRGPVNPMDDKVHLSLMVTVYGSIDNWLGTISEETLKCEYGFNDTRIKSLKRQNND